ncbi:MAG: hypothetical protein DRJ03_28435 [Chloroflexi bacterium]|nr:MAG: hypothetical protein DRJ03_28435 [Chloroflexota bacterium]
MEIGRRIERIEEDIAEIKSSLNDMSHALARVEESVEWTKMAFRILFGVIGIILGIIVTTL